MFMHNVSVGMCLLSLSYMILYKHEHIHSQLLTALIFVLGWLAFGDVLLAGDGFAKQVYIALLPLVFFLLMPLVYWYQASLVSEAPWQFTKNEFMHLVPVAIAFLLSISILLMPERDFTALFFGGSTALSTWSTINAGGFGLMLVAWLILSGIYLYHIVKKTRRYHISLAKIFASHEGKKLNWFMVFVGWMIFTWAYSLVVLVMENSLAHLFISETGVSVMLCGLIWLLCLHGMQRNPVFVEVGLTKVTPYERSALDDSRLERIADKIQQTVILEKAFLDPDINAVKLADRLGVSPHYLSQAFTQNMRTTFYDYINTARIETAKVALLQSDKTVLEVATDAGFNTRSAFYNAFKKNTGLTPSAYKQQQE